MGISLHLRRLLRSGLGCALLAAMAVAAPGQSQDKTQSKTQAEKPAPLQPGIPGMGANHRIILKDGTYQVARTYQIVGDRVRYFSQERGDWEELPASLVDWDATRKWELEHSGQPDDASPGMKEAAELDKEEAAERAQERAAMPAVAKGLELPNQDGVFVLDTFQGTPELVELVPSALDMHGKSHHGLSVLNPLAGEKAELELEGAHAKVHLHVNDPAIYLSLDTSDDKEPVLTHAFTVQTTSTQVAANGKHGAHSASSQFAIVQVDERRAVRMVGAIEVSQAGQAVPSVDVIPARVEVLPGKHWLKLTPEKPLLIGEYALVEILSPTAINPAVWDFRVDPTLGDNPGSLGPIL